MWFTRTFYKDIINRHSCGNCHFCNIHRPSDITIADFWGWEKTGSTINQDNKGVNLILINTEKAERYLTQSRIVWRLSKLHPMHICNRICNDLRQCIAKGCVWKRTIRSMDLSMFITRSIIRTHL